MDEASDVPPPDLGQRQNAAFWPEGWWRIVETRIGILPIPVFVILVLIIGVFNTTGKVPSDILMAIAILTVGGFSCAEIGKHIPVIRRIGASAILATFIPSALTYYQLLPAPVLGAVTDFTQSSNFLYLFISAIIVGSILGMDRNVLVAGFVKIFVPLIAGSVIAGAVGTLVGASLGLGAYHTLFFVVIPIMAGGVGEGAIPLSIGYAALMHQPQGDVFAQVLPPVMLGSLTAILAAGTLNFVGKKFPDLTGEGRLQPGMHDDVPSENDKPSVLMDVGTIAAAGVTAVSLYLIGVISQRLFNFPAPVTMLFLAVILKLTRAVPPSLQMGAFTVYRFFSTAVTYPLLFAIGVSLTPWNKLMAAFTPIYILTVISTVLTLMGAGFILGRMLKLYPIEAAIVNACHSGQGGTGDVAILTAANRMQLMPFASIATRIGGAITVTTTLIVLSWLL